MPLDNIKQGKERRSIFSMRNIIWLTADESTLVFYPVQEKLRLAWHVVLSGGTNQWDYFIDAQTGAVLADRDRRRF